MHYCKLIIMNVFLNLPPYLKAWVLCQYGESGVVYFPKGSLENNIMQLGMRKPRADESPMVTCPEGWTEVFVPQFRGVNLTSRNYLPNKTRIAIEGVILRRFDIGLWRVISTIDFKAITKKEIIEAWMEANGIEVDEPNSWSVMQRANRLLKRYADRVRIRRRRNSSNYK